VTDVLIRNVPEPVVETLKQWAVENRRSLESEILSILEEMVDSHRRRERFFREADELRTRLAKTGRQFSDSVDLIREDRER
jgi:plasmid stability protein